MQKKKLTTNGFYDDDGDDGGCGDDGQVLEQATGAAFVVLDLFLAAAVFLEITVACIVIVRHH